MKYFHKYTFFFLLLFFSIIYACKVENKLEMGKYYSFLNNYGKNPEKNTSKQNWLVAEAYRKSNRISKALPFYQQLMQQGYDNEFIPVYLAQGLKANQRYDEAKEILEAYISNHVVSDSNSTNLAELARKEIYNLQRIEALKKKSSYYLVKNLSDVNTAHAEYSPVRHSKYLYFTSNQSGGKIYHTTGTPYTDIFRMKIEKGDNRSKSIEKMDPIINNPNMNEGSAVFSSDGTLVIFARGNTGRSKGDNDVNLFYSRYRNRTWLKPVPLSINKPRFWDASPALSKDGKTLYFASNRLGGAGGTDIYVAKRNRRGRWVDVRNLGSEINTPGNENFPFISEDGSLYFSSDRHPGFGQLDIFRAVRDQGKVVVENLGQPMNSSADDFSFFQTQLTQGFFSSNRVGGKGNDDIYTFVNSDPNLKVVNYFLVGTTITYDDAENEVILPNTKVAIFDQNNTILDEAFTTEKGKFQFRVFPEEFYEVLGQKVGYFAIRVDFNTIGKRVDKSTLTEFVTNVEFEIKVVMEKIVLEKTIVLENIHYDLDKADIRPDAALVLDSLVQIMVDNPEIYIELGSHTDSRQSHEYNLDLSNRRAFSAVKYIQQKGIESKRITSKGYGETNLLINNAQTEEAHQRNRRTEFKVFKYSLKNEQLDEEALEEVDEYDRLFDDGQDDQ